MVADWELERVSVVELDAALLPAWLAHGHFAHLPLQDLLHSLLLRPGGVVRHGVAGESVVGHGVGEFGLEPAAADVVSVVRTVLHAACGLARLEGGGGALQGHRLVLCFGCDDSLSCFPSKRNPINAKTKRPAIQ